MNALFNLIRHFNKKKTQEVALVLSGGGARGLAHIGAIEALEHRGYRITSIAGTSMGALVGASYANGSMSVLKDYFLSMSDKHLFQAMELTLAMNHLSNDKSVMSLLLRLFGNEKIEHLPIDFCCCASDLNYGHEVVFRSGSLSHAVRASISIPGIFKPVQDGNMLLVDGSVHNTLPLNRVTRHQHDMLVAVNVSAPNPLHTTAEEAQLPLSSDNKTQKRRKANRQPKYANNYMNRALRVSQLCIQNNTQMAMKLTPPDLCIEMGIDEYHLFDYNKVREIIERGRLMMDEALDREHLATT